MTTIDLAPSAVVIEEKKPVLEPQRGACVEFVKFCKEQHLSSRAAHTFLRVLHNKPWEDECEKIRESMRPEIDRMFEPAEKALKEGRSCREVLDLLVHTLKETENM